MPPRFIWLSQEDVRFLPPSNPNSCGEFHVDIFRVERTVGINGLYEFAKNFFEKREMPLKSGCTIFVWIDDVHCRSDSSHCLSHGCNLFPDFSEHLKLSFKLNSMSVNSLLEFTLEPFKFLVETPSIGLQNSVCPYLPKQ